MASSRISVRIGRQLRQRIREEASRTRKRESDLVREALEKHLLHNRRESCYDIARRLKLIGCARGLPPDLSTNARYFEGFGHK